ncbi:hypothetical protein ACLB6G_02315 [Zhengella sp. ZM62]|uniref:hypothetical protein n=1 Tax=Zhengella sedimenti TaxID=3390035 RepID=UPI0039747C44
MSAVKARWRTYNRLQTLTAKVPEDYRQFNIENFRSELVSIADEWKLDQEKLAKISGLPPTVVASIMGYPGNRYGQLPSRNPNGDLSLAPDTRKLINGLLAWIGPSESDLTQLRPEKTDTLQAIVALGPHGRDFLDISSLGISQLEAELCNLTKTNQIEALAEIAFAMARLRDQIPANGLPANQDTESLRREIAVLQAKVEMLTVERDRLATQLGKVLDGSGLKSGFWQAVGAAPVGALVGAIGTVLGPEQAQAALSYVQTLVAVSGSGG